MRKTLTLRRETIAALTADDLATVHGASSECTTILTFLTCNVTCMTE